MILPESFVGELLMLNRTTPEHWRHLALLNYSLVTMNKPDMYSFLLVVTVHYLCYISFLIFCLSLFMFEFWT